jgi:hypothetical protein
MGIMEGSLGAEVLEVEVRLWGAGAVLLKGRFGSVIVTYGEQMQSNKVYDERICMCIG